jgi:hypothetical protein
LTEHRIGLRQLHVELVIAGVYLFALRAPATVAALAPPATVDGHQRSAQTVGR